MSNNYLLTAQTKSQLMVYREEIINFLNTVTIKFTPFAFQMGAKVSNKGANEIHEPWNPYYQNLCGEYSDLDTPMYIYAQEIGKDILFSKENLQMYPKSAALYRVPNKEYNTLISRYPNQGGLIKRIVYPAKDINTAIKAPDLSLLAFDDTLLFQDERESLITDLNEFLTMVRNRWWVPEYCYENLYATAFYSILWESLPNVLLSKRIDNIKTPFVHPFHIWEYLISHGLGDYRDILSMNQARWLYRNLPWILKNKGKEETLLELAKNILEEYRIDLGGITMFQETHGSIDTCTTTPYLITTQIETGRILDRINTEQLISKAVSASLIPPHSFDEVKEVEKTIANTDQNKLKTKYLEFVQKPIDTKYESILSEFLFDSFFYRYSTNSLSYKIRIRDTNRGLYYLLFPDEIIVLYYFVLHSRFGDNPTNLPSNVSVRIPYFKDKPDPLSVPVTFKLLGDTFTTAGSINVIDRINSVPWHPNFFKDHDDFISFTASQFKVLLSTMIETNTSADAVFHEAIGYLHDALLVRRTIPINFDNCTTIEEYRIKHSDVDDILKFYSRDESKTGYEELLNSLITGLFPLNSHLFKGIGIGQYDERIYNGLKNLFTQLCSYNITFLDTPRSEFTCIPLTMILVHTTHRTGTGYIVLITLEGIYITYVTNGTWTVPSGINLGISVSSIKLADLEKPALDVPVEIEASVNLTSQNISYLPIGLGVDIDLVGIDLNA